MQAPFSFAAALVVLAFAFRGADTFSLLPIAGLAWAVAAVLTAIAFRVRPTMARSNLLWALAAVAFLITLSVVFYRWPVRLGPVVYRQQFQSLADRVASGHLFTSPERIGPFTFQRGETQRGFVCLWTDLDSAGRSGYVRGTTDPNAAFNVWSVIPTGNGWHFLVED